MTGSDRNNQYIGAAAMAATVIFSMVLSAYLVNSFDLPWHFKTGEWIVKNRQVPTVDFWNFTRLGMEWLDAQWLFQVLCYLSYRLIGNSAFSVMMMVMTTSCLVLLLGAGSRSVPPSPRALVGLLMVLGMDSRIMCRPELLSCVYIAMMFFIMEAAMKGRKKILVLAPVVQLLWANSQGLWPIGIVIVGTYLGDQAVAAYRRRETAIGRLLPPAWLAVFAACLAACFVQPYGIKGVLFPFELIPQVTTSANLQKQTIVEVQSVFQYPPILRAVKFFFPLALISLAANLAAGRRLRPFLFLLSIAFVYLGLNARRNISVASVVLAFSLLIHLEIMVESGARVFLSRRLRLAAGLAVIATSLVLSGLTIRQPLRTWDRTNRQPGLGLSPRYYPFRAVRFLKSIQYRGNIITPVRLGGYLYYEGWPDWMVMADPRMEIEAETLLPMWQRVFVEPEVFNEVVQKYGADAVVVDLWDRYLRLFAERLRKDPEWALVFFDEEHKTLVFLKRVEKWRDPILLNEIKPE